MPGDSRLQMRDLIENLENLILFSLEYFKPIMNCKLVNSQDITFFFLLHVDKPIIKDLLSPLPQS